MIGVCTRQEFVAVKGDVVLSRCFLNERCTPPWSLNRQQRQALAHLELKQSSRVFLFCRQSTLHQGDSPNLHLGVTFKPASIRCRWDAGVCECRTRAVALLVCARAPEGRSMTGHRSLGSDGDWPVHSFEFLGLARSLILECVLKLQKDWLRQF